jgi:hypothetical protein
MTEGRSPGTGDFALPDSKATANCSAAAMETVTEDRASLRSHDCYAFLQLLCLTTVHSPLHLSFSFAIPHTLSRRFAIPSPLVGCPSVVHHRSPLLTHIDDQSLCQGTNPTTTSSLPSDTTQRRYSPLNGIHLVTAIDNRHTYSSRIQWTG